MKLRAYLSIGHLCSPEHLTAVADDASEDLWAVMHDFVWTIIKTFFKSMLKYHIDIQGNCNEKVIKQIK